MKAIIAIAKRLAASNKISFKITAAVVLLAQSSGDAVLSNGNYTWLLAIFTPFFFVFYDFRKIMYLGASKKDYYFACIISYVMLAFGISLLNTLIYLIVDPLYPAKSVINIMDVCRWTENGIAAAFFCQMFFLLLSMLFLHVLLFMQEYWYGWLTDALLVAVISIFTPIAPLRRILSGFFRIIMISSNAPLQIASCALLSIVMALSGLLVLKRKTL